MAPSGIAHQADALRVEPEIGRPALRIFLRKLVLPRGVKVGLGMSQRFRLFPEPVQAVEQLRI